MNTAYVVHRLMQVQIWNSLHNGATMMVWGHFGDRRLGDSTFGRRHWVKFVQLLRFLKPKPKVRFFGIRRMAF